MDISILHTNKRKEMTADNLRKNEKGIIKNIIGDDILQRHRLLDLGFVPGTEITCTQRVFGTYAMEVKGSQYGLRTETVKNIILES